MDISRENRIIYDWVSITSKIHDVSDIKMLIGMENVPWVAGTGQNGFPYAEYYDSVKIHFGRDDGFIWLDMSGQGCRAFESYGNGNYEMLFNEVIENPDDMNITRLDVAYDDTSGILCMDTLISDCRANNFISRASDWKIEEGNKTQVIYHGSKRSEVLIRIYNKALERGFTDGRHWIRVEMQFRRDRAFQFINQLGDIGVCFCGVLLNYLRYVEPIDTDTNKWRFPLTYYWGTLCEQAARISIYEKVGVDYNLFNLSNYVFNQAGNAIETAVEIYGREGFFSELANRETRKNPKYALLLQKHKEN